jgi:hypothetical protein
VFNASTGLPVTGVANTLTANLAQDSGPRVALVTNVATEVEDGYYTFQLDSNETNATTLDLYPQSSTAGSVALPLPATYQTTLPGVTVGDNPLVPKGVSFSWRVVVFDSSSGLPVTGTADTLTANIAKDGGVRVALESNVATELEDGYYIFTLSASEATATTIDLYPQSSINGYVALPLPATYYTSTPTVIPDPGAIQYTHYGTMTAAIEYFSNRLFSDPWERATIMDKRRGLIAASRIIDTLNYKGSIASPTQYHEFPRGADTRVPSAIEQACYEIAMALLDNRDPDMELEALGISSQGIESVRTTYSRNQVPIEHLINGVPSNSAWRLIRPFLRDEDAIFLVRV